MIRITFLPFLFLPIFFACNQQEAVTVITEMEEESVIVPIKGMSFVAPPDPFPKEPIQPLVDVGVDWISIIPYGFTPQGKKTVSYNNTQWQWWGETPDGIIETIRQAHAKSIKTMLKPQIYVPGDWPGGITFSTEADWQEWESAYTEFIFKFVDIAVEHKVEMLCIGTEFKGSTEERNHYWVDLIKKIREKYNGELTYAANWDEYTNIEFWGDLDFIGVDAYFPLVDKVTPTVAELKESWETPKAAMKTVADKFDRPILFTEYGYLSVDGCAHNNWELEKNIDNLSVNELAQANAIDAALSSFWIEPYWRGGFLWKWFPNNQGHEGYIEKDYTPQDKQSLEILKKWFLD